MNKTKIQNFQIFSVIFTFMLGTLLHFTFNLSGQDKIVAVFSSINESVWEHLKLIYFPMLITTVIGYFCFNKSIFNFLCAKTIGILTSICFTIIFFYTYTGIIGNTIAFVDILSFFITIILGEYLSYRLIVKSFNCNNKVSIIILALFFISFFIFTFFTPNIGLFKDPLTDQYGIVQKYIT